MKLECYQQSLKADQKINQDAMAHKIEPDSAFFVIADGLGGHQGGEIISRVFCENLINTADDYKVAMFKDGKTAMLRWFNQAIVQMNQQLDPMQCSQQAHTTCAILWIDSTQVMTAHIGDSRIYRFNNHKKCWRTRDHSVPQMLFDEGEINEQEIATHPDQNRLTRSINRKTQIKPSIKTYPKLTQGDTFLLCTDGFWTQSTEAELIALAQAKTTEQNLKDQASLAIKRAKGNSDNVTWQWLRSKKKDANRPNKHDGTE